MSKQIKKVLSLLLAVTLLFGAAPLNGFVGLELPKFSALFAPVVHAADPTSGTCGANLTWSYNTSTKTLTISGTGAMNNYDYEYYNGTYVTTAPWRPYYNTMQTLVINSGVTGIESSAFSGCTGLTSVTISNSVTSIGWDAFGYCTGLTSVTIPDSVTSISSYAFANCTRLTSVTIGNSVTSIGSGAFLYCTGLTSVIIPDSVKSIGDSAFFACTGLTAISVSAGNLNYSSDSFGVLYNKNKTELIQYPVGSPRASFTVPDSVTSIGEYAFEDCTGLTSVTIGNSVTSIGYDAFYRCTGLTSVTIGNSVTSIGSWAFGYCTGLTSVIIPDSVTSIDDSAFEDCTGLTSVTIPDSVTSIGNYAFDGCTKLKDVYYTGSEAQWKIIGIDSYNDPLINATIHYNSTGDDPSGEEPSCDIKVMSYNVFVKNETVTDLLSGKQYNCSQDKRAPYIINNILSEMPDSIGFQEVDQSYKAKLETTSDLSGRKLGTSYTGVGDFRGGSGNNEGNFIYYNNKKYTLVASGTHWLSETGAENSKHTDSEKYNRIFTYALLRNKSTGLQYLHLNTHLEHDNSNKKGIKNDNAARFSVAKIYDFIEINYPNIPVVITGDFNHDTNSYVYNYLIQRGYTDARGSNTEDTYINPYGETYKDNNDQQYHYNGKKKIDHILVNSYFTGNGKINAYDVIDEDYSDVSKYGSKALEYPYPSDHHAIIADLTACYHSARTTTAGINYSIKGTIGVTSVSFNPDWLSYNNKIYNNMLAKFCANYVMMGYCYNDDLKPWLAKMGFAEKDTVTKWNTGRNEVNYFITSKQAIVGGLKRTIVFAAAIGSDGEQWFSDFESNGVDGKRTSSYNSNKDHLGFGDARQFVYNALTQYMDDYGLDKSNTILLLSGHSRGAAAANLLAAQMLREGKVYGNRLFAYTFATPNVTTDTSVSSSTYKCIFNIVNPEDFVPRVMPEAWHYGRYGTTFYLPSKTNTKTNIYNTYKSSVSALFRQYTYGNNTYQPYLQGEATTYNLVKKITDNVKSVTEYYRKKLKYMNITHTLAPQGISAFEYFHDAICPIITGSDISSGLEIIAKTFDNALLRDTFFYFLDPSVRATFYTLIAKLYDGENIITSLVSAYKENINFAHAHMMETYCAYVDYLDGYTLEMDKKTDYGAVRCPVDIEIYDDDTNELVGRIKDNTVDETVAEKENAVVMCVDGDSKEFWLPGNGNYRVVLTGNDDGTMDYTVADITSGSMETKRVNFFDVEVEDGGSITDKFTLEQESANDHVIVLADGSELAPTETVAEGNKEYQINTSTEGSGYASESRTAVSGDYVQLAAEPVEGGEFLGWYENGKLISSEAELSFVAKANRNLTAKFTVVTEPATLTKIAVKDMPAKTTYTVGDSFDSTGLTLTATYSDNSTKTIVSGFTCSGFSSTTKGKKTITVTFEGKTTTLTVAVVDKTYTLTYDANGGSGAPASQTGNGWIKLSDVELTKEGYIFRGWATRPDLDPDIDGVYYGIGVHFNLTADTTLYAVWRKAKVRSVSLSDITVNYKSSTTLKPSVTDEGIKYTAQYESSNPSVVSVDNRGKVTGMKRGSATITVTVMDEYGNIEKDTCTVTVRYSLMQWIIKILLFGWLWY